MNTDNPYADLPPGSGPDGSSLLGFLSAVGALVSFTTIYPDKKVTLHWEQSLGWMGRILIDGKQIEDQEINELYKYLTKESTRETFNLEKEQGSNHYKTITKLGLSDAQRYLEEALQESNKTKRYNLCSTYAGWFLNLNENNAASSSKLCALTGGSQQNFLETALHLSGFHEKHKDRDARITTKDHLQTTLFEPWKYQEPMPGCRWEAQEDRHYALRHRDPTQVHKSEGAKDYDGKVRTQRGANRLGIEALSIFPLIPNTKRAETPSFSYSRESGYVFTWPIWASPLTLASIRVLVAHPELTSKEPRLDILSPLGVSALFRVERIKKGEPPAQQVSFTISEAL